MTPQRRPQQVVLILVFCFCVLHLAKDITQDILHIETPLDALGNLQEDLSWLPKSLQHAYMGLGVLSGLSEVFIVLAIPLILWRGKDSLIQPVLIATTFLFLYLISALLLDPRFL